MREASARIRCVWVIVSSRPPACRATGTRQLASVGSERLRIQQQPANRMRLTTISSIPPRATKPVSSLRTVASMTQDVPYLGPLQYLLAIFSCEIYARNIYYTSGMSKYYREKIQLSQGMPRFFCLYIRNASVRAQRTRPKAFPEPEAFPEPSTEPD